MSSLEQFAAEYGKRLADVAWHIRRKVHGPLGVRSSRGLFAYNAGMTIRLLTMHPTGFRIDAADTRLDVTQGEYWRNPAYQKIIPEFHRRVGDDQFLWTFPDEWPPIGRPGRTLWELIVPNDEILATYDYLVWDAMYHGGPENWDNLRVGLVLPPTSGLGCLVKFPLAATVGVTCIGEIMAGRQYTEERFS